MSYKSKEIGELANYIVKELKIHNDRMLFTKLKLKEEDKELLVKWIYFQQLQAERAGFEAGQDDIRFRMKQLLIPNREEQ